MTRDQDTPATGARAFYWTAGLLMLALAGYLCCWPVPVEPVAWIPDANGGLAGAYAASRSFDAAGFKTYEVGRGPEDVALGAGGTLYSGLEDGRIMRLRPGEAAAELFADTGGRPLGMQFDADGNLIVADGLRGLLSVDPAGTVTVLTNSVNGETLKLVDDLDIAADGTIWFSNASQNFGLHHLTLDWWEGAATGQLLSYEPRSGRTRLRLAGLRFANGVALGPDEAFVLVSETRAARISRLWLSGPDAGKRDVFAAGLPGLPDNLSFNGHDTFWVAFYASRSEAFDRLAPRPGVRKLLLRLPESWVRVVPPPIGWIVGLGLDGQARYSFRDTVGRYTEVTSVNERDGKLYLGSLKMSAIASLDVPK